MVRGRTLFAVTLLACACGLLCPSSGVAGDATAAHVAQIWAGREKRAQSYRVAWSVTTTYPKGSFYAAPRVDPKDAPTTDLSIPGTCQLLVAGKKSRYEYRGQMWSAKNRRLEPSEQLVTFDGEKYGHTSFQSSIINNPQVTLTKRAESSLSRSPENLPLWLTARASLATDLPIERFAATGRKEAINGRLCHEFTRTVSKTERERVFLDPERDYQVVRENYFEGEKLTVKIDINYQPGPDARLGTRGLGLRSV